MTSLNVAISYDKKEHFYIKDPGSSITHFIALIVSITGAFPLLFRSRQLGSITSVVSMTVFMISMILLYAASTTYHTFDKSVKVNTLLKKLDHCMIPVLIAGSYTPICLVVLKNTIGYVMFAVVWSIAILAIGFKIFWVTCPKWVSSTLYIVMGWTCIMAMPQIYAALPAYAFYWLLIGGILYTIGGVIYALKMPAFNKKHKNFGTHEIFHLFVMAGSACHYIMMYIFVAPL